MPPGKSRKEVKKMSKDQRKSGPLDDGPSGRRSELRVTDPGSAVNSEDLMDKFSDIQVPPHLTDLGNCQHLVTAFGASLRYCWLWSKWLIWNGTRWKKDDIGLIYLRAKETIRLIYILAGGKDGMATEIEDKDMAKHALKSESSRALEAMVKLARSEPGVPVLPGELDSDLFKLNVLNGTVNLRTGELKHHEKADLITKIAPVEFNKDAKCPLLLEFLDKIMAGNAKLIGFLQRAVGYSLTGDVSERVLFVLHGPGDNGKTTFVETIRALVGDYGLETPVKTLLVKRDEGISNDIAGLRGARLVTASESEEGRRLAEAMIKALTGNKDIRARFLYTESFQFRPECKIWLDTNHKPVIRGTDPAIWNRIKLIPFSVVIPESKQDKHFGDKLKEELPGILAWAVQGCLAWQRDTLSVPSEVKTATTSYRLDMDILGSFLEDCCVVSPNVQTTVKALWNAYLEWCEGNGEKPIGKRTFGMRLAERGFDRAKSMDKRLWKGVCLTSEPPL